MEADFKPVRKKKHDNRRQSRRPALQESAASVPPKGVSLSAFAHSAIEKGGGEADSEVRSSEVRSSSSRKSRKQTMKRKVGIGGWGRMLAQWEAGKEDADSSDSDIQSYSEGEGELAASCAESTAAVSCRPTAIATVSSDEDFADTTVDEEVRDVDVVVKQPNHMERRKRKGRPSQSRNTDVPIEDFISSSSDSADGGLHFNLSKHRKKGRKSSSHPPAGTTDHMTIATPPSSPPEPISLPEDSAISTPPSSPLDPMTILPDYMTISTPLSSQPEPDYSSDHMTISTPPTSPELASTVGGFTTSDWVKQMHRDGVDIASKSRDFSDTSKTPVDSAKKRPSRKLVLGGMAQRLQRLIQRERSEVTFWEHKTRTMKPAEEGVADVPHSLTVHVQSLSNCCSVVAARCKVLHGNVDPPTTTRGEAGTSWTRTCVNNQDRLGAEDEVSPGNAKMVTILFSLRCARFIGLVVGGHVRIHPPWQTLHLVRGGDVILCPHFAISVGFSPLPVSPFTAPPPPQRFGCGLSTLSRSPAKGLVPTRLFADSVFPTASADPLKTPCADSAPVTATPTPPLPQRDSTPLPQPFPPPISILDAITTVGARVGVANAFTATILRVFRRARSGRGLACDGMTGSVVQEILGRARLAGVQGPLESSWRWSLLVRDSAGYHAEIKMPSNGRNRPSWSILIEKGEGKECFFSKVRVCKKLDSSREPALFSLMSSLEPVDEVITASSGDHTHLTCYSMEWQDYSHFQLCSLLANMPCPGSSSSSSVAGTRGTSKRINLRAKIISFQSEIVLPLSDHTPSTQCGHYLNVAVTPVSPGDYTAQSQASQCDYTSLSQARDDKMEDENAALHIRGDNGGSGGVGGGGNNAVGNCGSGRGNDVASSVGSNVVDGVDGALTITVYLKQGFVVDGLHGILSSHGEAVLLRDVECLKTQGCSSPSFLMDACSLLFPASSAQQVDSMLYPTITSSIKQLLCVCVELATPPIIVKVEN